MNRISSIRTLVRWLFSGRLSALWPWLLSFLALQAAVRIGLAAFNGEAALFAPWRIIPALAIGALFDLGVALCFAAPMALLLSVWPCRRLGGDRSLRLLFGLVLVALSVLLAFVAFAEFTFWNEFASRFNFIAVDYLVYTSEVIGNIRESYDLPVLLTGVGAAALVLWAATMRFVGPRVKSDAVPARWPVRAGALMVWLLLPAVGVFALDARYKEFSSHAQLNELAGDGIWDFWHAFRVNEIDYDRFYKTLPRQRAVAKLALELSAHKPGAVTREPFDREVSNPGPEQRLNVVLVSIESFSASFMAHFGDTQGLTPNMDRLADAGLLFTHLYATGTRTVRGLEALTLSVPPTPGHSIVKRPDNADLFNVGGVFKSRGYEPLFLYGGYGYFDNMNAFFAGNGYTVIDRTALQSNEIHFQNIWGVADEDLFTLALRELDARHASGMRFFAHIMTTSNHRPFTYPDGRIDIPSRTRREGGVKYTDYAIGQFIERARTRPWFADTMFVFVADHTHNARGRTELPPPNYLIPLIIYSPAHVAPARVDTIASQIDVAPTLLGLLNFSYHSKFFGQDILREGRTHPRALLANYQTVGYYESGRVVELRPNQRTRVVDAASGQLAPDDALSRELVDEAVSYYQLASEAYRLGELRAD